MGTYNFLSEILILSVLELIWSPKMVPWILEVQPSSLELKVHLASITTPLAEKPSLSAGCFLERETHSIGITGSSGEACQASRALNLYLHVTSSSAILWRQTSRRPARGVAEGQPDWTAWTTHPYSPQKFEKKIKWISLNTTSGRFKYNIWTKQNKILKAPPIGKVEYKEKN